ncbi:hypothetical protein [Larkinella rosea]|uniref:DUF932 domain-containing protein n=1 Tax=Larkinella rosea TaxID=2025312 RepID=A0A3P1C3Y4_9BACT|nr:hypothetical protein [Larkinella rosea]RRB07833.1 hypothetical protein EHT25_08675 [Larkinella rosea]
MTYLSAQPQITESWDDICYPVQPVWLTELLPDYDIVATDRQQLIVGQMAGGRKTLFGIQSADYTIIPNAAIRAVVDQLIPDYHLLIKYTTTGEFSISIVLPTSLSVGSERLKRSLILTNSYNGRTPFSIQGQTLTALPDSTTQLGSSLYRSVCQNGLLGWADPFTDLNSYQNWLEKWTSGKEKVPSKGASAQRKPERSATDIRKLHHRALTIERFQEYLHKVLLEHLQSPPSLTTTVYNHLQQVPLSGAQDRLLRQLPIPVQLAKQASERLRLEERLLDTPGSYWLLYNAVNYALFTSRSSLTLNDRYRLDERVFHQLAAHTYA